MSLFAIASTVVLVSLTGVMAPGPLFVANVRHGMRGGIKSGLYMAAGHTIVEFPLVLLLGIGMLSLKSISSFSEIIAAIGAASLFVFATLQIIEIVKGVKPRGQTSSQYKETKNKPHNDYYAKTKDVKGPVSAGLLLTGLNPFFLTWWATVGLKLISDSVDFIGFYGLFVMFGFHIWLDYAWMSTVGYLSSKGKKILNDKQYKIIIVTLSAILVYFGIEFSLEALHQPGIMSSSSLSV